MNRRMIGQRLLYGRDIVLLGWLLLQLPGILVGLRGMQPDDACLQYSWAFQSSQYDIGVPLRCCSAESNASCKNGSQATTLQSLVVRSMFAAR